MATLNTGRLASAILKSIAGLALAAGDLLYATATDAVARLPKGTAGQVLRMNAGATAPEWADVAGVSGLAMIAYAKVNFSGGTYSLGASSGIASVTRVGTGNITVTFSSARSNTNYIAIVSARAGGVIGDAESHATGSFAVRMADANATAYDGGFDVVVFG